MSTTIGPALHTSLLILELGLRKRESALLEMARRAHLRGAVREPELLHSLLVLSERIGGAVVGKGVAVADARSLTLVEPHVVVAPSRPGIDWDAPDGEAVRLVLLVLSPPEIPPATHQQSIARATVLVRSARTRQKLLEAGDADEVESLLRELSP